MKLILMSLLVCIVAGCGVTMQTRQSSEPKDCEKMVYIKPKIEGYKAPWSNEGMSIPNWINDPSMDGRYNAAVGSCFIDGLSYAEYREKAYASAVNELGRSQKVRVKSIQKDYQTNDGINYFEGISKLESVQEVSNAKIVSTWTQPNTKEYFVWVVVSK